MTVGILLAIVQTFGIFFVGWLARRLKYVDENDINRWSRVVVDFLMPMLVFHTITRSFEAGRLGELWPLPLLGLGIIVLGALCGIVLRMGVRSPDPRVPPTFHHFCAINNYGYLPIIIVSSLWGDEGLARLFFFNLGSSIGYWTIGVGLLGGSVRRAAKNILGPNLAALALALALCLTGLNNGVPEIVMRISGTIGAAAVPSILILIGASLHPLPKIVEKFDIAYISAVRLLLLPFLIIAILVQLPLHPDVRSIAFIVALMPGTVSSTIITRRFGGSPEFAAQAAVVTTILSIATIPPALMLLQKAALL